MEVCEIPEQTHISNRAVIKSKMYCEKFLEVISELKSLADVFDLASPTYVDAFDNIEHCMEKLHAFSIKLASYKGKMDDEWKREIDLSIIDIEVNISFDIHAIISAFLGV